LQDTINQEIGDNRSSIGIAERSRASALWVRHHAKNITSSITDTGNIAARSIRTSVFGNLAVSFAIAKENLLVGLEAIE
jgi:hypothetical protein